MGTHNWYIISRKIQSSIEWNLQSIIDGTFTEQNLKVLMVDLRWIWLYLKNKVKEDSKAPKILSECMEEFLELCNFIFHSENSQWLIKERAELNDKILASIRKSPNNEETMWEFGFVALLNLYNSFVWFAWAIKLIYPKKKNLKSVLFEHKNEIILCMMSLLQDHKILWSWNIIRWVICIINWEWKYLLEYTSYFWKFQEKLMKENPEMKWRLINEYPIYASNIECDENVLRVWEKTSDLPVETYRDSGWKLRFRLIERYTIKGGVSMRPISAILINFQKLAYWKFTEVHIKELLIDFRERIEFVKQRLKDDAKDSEILFHCINQIAEICKLIGHNTSNNSIFATIILNYITHKTTEALEWNTIFTWLQLIIERYFFQNKIPIPDLFFEKIKENKSEVILSILSLMQDCTLEFDDESIKIAYMFIDCQENKYILSARVIMKDGSTFNVPLIYTECLNIWEVTIDKGSLFETYRDESDILKLREV